MAGKNIRLKGHESFFIREGWLSKGLELVSKNPHAFREYFGADELGVGTNMAKSIRYWLKVCGFMKEIPKEGAFLTPLGACIRKYDPYMEDDFSLWLAHIHMCTNQKQCTAWYLFFQEFHMEEFNKEELFQGFRNLLEVNYHETDISTRSLMDDCSVLLSTYATIRKEKEDPEDKSVCPFVKLGLVKKSGEKYRKAQPLRAVLDKDLVFYLIQSYFLSQEHIVSISIDELEKKQGFVGSVMNVKRGLLLEYLEELADEGYITLNRTAGLDMVYKNSRVTTEEIIERYYTRNGRE